KFLHKIELALGAVERTAAQWFRHAFKIAERLEQSDFQSQIACHTPHLTRTFLKGEKVVLENLDTVEASFGNGFEFLWQITTDRNRCYRSFHESLSRSGLPYIRI